MPSKGQKILADFNILGNRIGGVEKNVIYQAIYICILPIFILAVFI